MNNLKTFFLSIKKIISSVFLSIKELTNKQNIKFLLLFFISITLISVSGITVGKCLSSNQSFTLFEIAEEYKKDNNESPYGLIYPKKLSSQDVMTYRMPEYSQTLRSTYPDFTIIDLYQSKWNNLYSPGVVNYLEEQDVHVSFLMMPRLNTYITNKWLYEMPLLYPLENSLSNFRGLNDIFINKEYAEYLLQKYKQPLDNYSFLCKDSNLQLEDRIIPYYWNWSETTNGRLINNTYSIKGVIDSTSEEYLSLKNICGDFFIVNEFFSLPLPPLTLFETKLENRNDLKLIDLILNTYKYNSTISYSGFYNTSYLFEYRITFFGNFETNLSINCIETNPTIYNKKTDNLFDFFVTKQNLFLLLPSIIINVAFLIFSLRSIIKAKAILTKQNKNKKIVAILLSTINVCVAFVFGILLMKFFNPVIPIFAHTTYMNFIGFLLPFIEIVILICCLFFKRKIKQ